MPLIRRFVPLFALALLLSTPAVADFFDLGRLDAHWFSPDAVFREDSEIDYLWVSPGFTLTEQTLHFVPWPEPKFLGGKARDRDANDRRLARMMNADLHMVFADAFAHAFGDELTVSTESGEILVEGRIVDCSTGSDAAKAFVGFGAGAGSVTIDLRFVDAESGKALAGLHHRVVSGTNWSTTDSKFIRWVDKMAKRIAERGLQSLYESGKNVRK
ncbi:MAG TPA: DUF4410 domain-containing protein [Thermoanaerobaculia bacterium]|nr:DUF4410 domain-containing protein [Thermoanaerobaculia bacterium]